MRHCGNNERGHLFTILECRLAHFLLHGYELMIKDSPVFSYAADCLEFVARGDAPCHEPVYCGIYLFYDFTDLLEWRCQPAKRHFRGIDAVLGHPAFNCPHHALLKGFY